MLGATCCVRLATVLPSNVATCCVGMLGSFGRGFKDVRAHWCASLVRTLYLTWRLPRHVFQARAPSRNSTKHRADGLCVNLVCGYLCWMLGDPHLFLRQISSFPLYYGCVSLRKSKIAFVNLKKSEN